jgi:hypothetical protein
MLTNNTSNKHTNNPNLPNANQGTRVMAMFGIAFMGAGFAMFMWWKMRMVTGIPRTAYAEPRLVDATPTTTPPEVTPAPAAHAASLDEQLAPVPAQAENP